MTKMIMIGTLLFAAAPAYCDVPEIVAANNQVSAHITSTSMDYTEIGDGSLGSPTGILDTEKGQVPGLSASGSYMDRDSKAYFQMELGYSSGDTNYTGASLSGGGSYGSLLGVSPATLVDLKGRTGMGFEAGDSAMLTPYAELGWHVWHRGVNFGENYTYYHYGIGLIGQVMPAEKLVLSAHLLAGRTSNAYINVKGFFSGPLGDAAYSNAGLAADLALPRQLHARFAMEFIRFRFGRSDFYPYGPAVVWEPDSESRYTVLKFGLGYGF